ncbi:MAG: (Fe-S)-binding protein, partial [Natronomonas sp.]
EATLGIARERTLPTFEDETFREWFDDRRSSIDSEDADRRVVLLPDPFSMYIEPDVARAAVRVLEAAGVAVTLPDVDSSGRAAYSKGFLDLAATRARAVVDELDPLVNEGWDVVAVEPSEAVMLQTEYLDVLGDEAETVASATYGVCEYVDRFDLDSNLAVEGSGSVVYHGHCHQKATRRDHHAVAVLRRAGYEVTALDSTCCGMAGSFGYEAEHYSMSQAIGRLLFQQVDAAAGEPVAPGASCRTQLGDRDGSSRPDHPIERLSAAIVE